jgi:hypothetical protein
MMPLSPGEVGKLARSSSALGLDITRDVRLDLE